MTAPGNLPLLLFGQPVSVPREALRPGRGFGGPVPDAATQGRRLGGKWQALQDAMEQRRTTLATSLGGIDPELVLVFEVAGSVEDFARAVARIPGFEFLAEMDEDAIDDVDDVFTPSAEDDDVPAVTGTMYLLATNQQALAAVLDLWQLYQTDEDAKFPHNLGRWKRVFQHLNDVRRWSARDRLQGTGAEEDFARRAALGQDVVPAELELWFRTDQATRTAAAQSVQSVVEAAGGTVVATAQIPEIAYHSMLVTLPIGQLQPLLEGAPDDLALLRVEELAFVRPQAVVAIPFDGAETPSAAAPMTIPSPTDTPIVGVLDGVPVAAHQLLAAHVQLDDPDDLQADAPAQQRQHGTAMVSLVIHGDLSGQTEPLRSPVYVRPVLTPDTLFDGRVVERIPASTLAVDLVHRAVRRMFDGEAGNPPTAPTVRIINLALGDTTNPLALAMTPWARLLDWLSHRYGVVFVVSAGNHDDPITLPLSAAELAAMQSRQIRLVTFRALGQAAQQRRLLSPAESVNALTVGASHDDQSAVAPTGSRLDPFPDSGTGTEAAPSPFSSIGLGYRKNIKPDVLAPGGRLLFRPEPTTARATPTILRPQGSPISVGPGLSVAAPGTGGTLTHRWFLHGTSGAAAITTHYLGLVIETLQTLRDPVGIAIPVNELGVLAKALIVHSARIPRSSAELGEVLAPNVSARRMRAATARFYGYGILNPIRLRAGELTRVTLLGTGSLRPGEGHRYAVPLPPSLSGQVVTRRLTVTVASLLPTRPRDHRHRASEVYFVPDTDTLLLSRVDADNNLVRKGALQHEVLEGSRAAAFVAGDELTITVSCREVGPKHRNASLYGLAVTLEVPSDTQLPIYNEVETRVRELVTARARASVRR